MKDYQNIATSKRDRILTIKLNRPEKLNAASAVMHEELSRVFTDAAQEPDADLVILTGEGRAFSAGGDVDYLRSVYKNADAVTTLLRESRQIIAAILDMDIPIIAAVNGDAIGLGATLALFCDIVVAVDTARIGDPHVRVGLVAGDGGAVIWPLLVGPARAKEYLMTGNVMTATEAERIGLINYSVPAEQFWPTVDRLAGAILSNPQRAVRWTKRAVNKQLLQATNMVLELALSLEGHTMMSEDVLEATTAFVEKRAPHYKRR